MKGLMAQYLVFCLFFFFSHLCVVYPLPFYNSSSSVNHLCSPEETLALLRFKNSFSFYDSTISESWKEGTDCCKWDGITCDRWTRHVIGLDLSSNWVVGNISHNSTLFNLRHLRRLNLAYNSFNRSEISPRFGDLSKLRHLNLSSSDFSGLVPTKLSQLSKLVSLDLGSNDLRINQQTLDELLKNVTELKHLILDSVDMSFVDPGSLANLSISLISLNLETCLLQGKFPSEVFHLPFLQQLKAYGNEALTGEVPASLSHLGQLTWLDLSFNKFSGELPDVFGNLSRITHIGLEGNNFSGQFPSSIFNITRLSYLDFSSNRLLSGSLPHQISDLPYLTYLSLEENSLTGQLPPWLFAMPSLEKLFLGDNNLTGTIEQPQQINSSLSWVVLSSNELSGPFPNFLFELKNLSHLYLSSNKLSGVLRGDMFVKLQKLEILDLSNNNLSIINTTNNNFTLPNMGSFSCDSCDLTEIPSFLKGAKNLTTLVLQNNRISGRISSADTEAWPHLMALILSKNSLTGFEINISLTSLSFLDLSSNMLQGPLMDLPYSIQYFSVSQNKLIGEIPSSFCNLSSILLDLSNNNLSGTIPQCLGNQNNLGILNLGSFLKDSMLTYLILNDNQLEGPLPRSLINCTWLEVLDVRNNKISDTFPHWSATLQYLIILVLRSNKFHGTIGNPQTRFSFPKLQILDISRNKFTGLLPTEFFDSFGAMMNLDGNISKDMYMFNGSEIYQLTITMKGINAQMVKILRLFATIDLSSNQFEGPIPKVVGNLNSLKVLNFSHNHLIGPIPYSLGNLTVVESLDLSSNKLFGKIPKQLTVLNWLSVLNVSYNRLIGPIPQGPQFNTFDYSSYIGNMGLCGLPLSKKCGNDETSGHVPSAFSKAEEDDTWEWFWKIVMMGYGSGFVIGVSIAYMIFTTGKPFWIIKMYDRIRQRWINFKRPRERRKGGRRN